MPLQDCFFRSAAFRFRLTSFASFVANAESYATSSLLRSDLRERRHNALELALLDNGKPVVGVT